MSWDGFVVGVGLSWGGGFEVRRVCLGEGGGVVMGRGCRWCGFVLVGFVWGGFVWGGFVVGWVCRCTLIEIVAVIHE